MKKKNLKSREFCCTGITQAESESKTVRKIGQIPGPCKRERKTTSNIKTRNKHKFKKQKWEEKQYEYFKS